MTDKELEEWGRDETLRIYEEYKSIYEELVGIYTLCKSLARNISAQNAKLSTMVIIEQCCFNFSKFQKEEEYTRRWLTRRGKYHFKRLPKPTNETYRYSYEFAYFKFGLEQKGFFWKEHLPMLKEAYKHYSEQLRVLLKAKTELDEIEAKLERYINLWHKFGGRNND